MCFFAKWKTSKFGTTRCCAFAPALHLPIFITSLATTRQSSLQTLFLPLFKTNLLALKLLQCLLYLEVQLRAIHFTLTVDMESESSLRANIAVNPLGALLVGQYRFLTITVAYPVFIATSWILYLDYMFTYQMKGVFLDTAYLALVSNGKNFQALNSHWLNFPSIKTTFSWWHWWRSPAKYLALWRQILNIFKGKNSTLNTVCHFHPHLIWSIRLSSQLRGRLYVFSHFAELLVVIFNIAYCMINLFVFV